jgi:serine phosphatase RsbU (regulator of sigma subunit)
LLYTDGITEAWRKGSVPDHRDPKKDMFGIERLKDILCGLGDRSTDDIRRGILKELAGYTCIDDVTMVIIKRIE